ncbi:histidine phosphatase superfamily [Lasiosphaeria miniovina]|uniref:Histidine phosphatase superfamily n=1 Tax=Lasiosphaeria miniovina TaxID=1954250 RepID=A0AA40B5L7_9PEZI|nr:histidine phosphatase superfamily [Lasiosphaeria miniovina]KAK0727793.1 histidine phosphatase superfamily [Lasiosphaeria miniovina]
MPPSHKQIPTDAHVRHKSLDSTVIHILRHGQSLHNIERGYPHRDPPLTELGEAQARAVQLPAAPDLIIISPMTRAIQTALLVFGTAAEETPPDIPRHAQSQNPVSVPVPVQVWPDLRETHDHATCNKGLGRAALAARFPGLDFSLCGPEWDEAYYPAHSAARAEARAERVRSRLCALARSGLYENIVLVTHRGFVAFLVPGARFGLCESRRYRFATESEAERERFGVNVDSDEAQDFGPTVLVPCEDLGQPAL